MRRSLRLLLSPAFYLFLVRRLRTFMRQQAIDFLAPPPAPLPARRLSVAAGAQVGRHVIINVESTVGETDSARIEIGERAFVEDGAELGLIPGALLRIGRNSSIHRGCVILGNVRIGANCIFSYNIYAASGMHAVRERPAWLVRDQDEAFAMVQRLNDTVWIDDDAYIGWGVYVRSGVHIGRGAVIGANAAVMSDVEPYAIYAGTPARKIGQRLEFAPPAQIAAVHDEHLPYFYGGFLDDQASLAKSRPAGLIRLAGEGRMVLRGGRGGTARITGTVEGGGPDVTIRVSVGGKPVAEKRVPAGEFSLEVALAEPDLAALPPLLHAYTVLGLDAAAEFARIGVREVVLTGGH
jgi:acetyltransferase-like isoleucine patch superfamily enzyme